MLSFLNKFISHFSCKIAKCFYSLKIITLSVSLASIDKSRLDTIGSFLSSLAHLSVQSSSHYKSPDQVVYIILNTVTDKCINLFPV